MTLDEESRKSLVLYRLERARSTYEDAVVNFRNGSYNSAINRLYYSIYYCVIALLIKNGIEAKTHDGVRRMFSLHFIYPKLIDNKYNIFYNQVFQGRVQGDYDDFFYFDEETTGILLEKGKEFILTITEFIEKFEPKP